MTPEVPLCSAVTRARGVSNEAEPRCDGLTYLGDDYVLLGIIARGGMGEVYYAQQVSLNRPVAVKLIRTLDLNKKSAIRQFQIEASVMAALDHPNIVPIYEIGQHDGMPYFSMRLVEGTNLANYLEEQRPNPRRAAEILYLLSDAVHCAHVHGVVHRDLKPGNILIDEKGEPYVTDFGIAKLFRCGVGITAGEAMYGTPEYMAPEEFENGIDVTPAADIYSLGAILYHMFTGGPPFKGLTLPECVQQIFNDYPICPRLINPRVDRDLVSICLKCLEKEPSRRYATAESLAEDLKRYLDGYPVGARPLRPVERFYRWFRKHPLVVTLALALIFLIAFFAQVAVWYGIKERDKVATLEAKTIQLIAENTQLENEKQKLAQTLTEIQPGDVALEESAFGVDGRLELAGLLRTTPPNDVYDNRYRTLAYSSEREWFVSMCRYGASPTNLPSACDGMFIQYTPRNSLCYVLPEELARYKCKEVSCLVTTNPKGAFRLHHTAYADVFIFAYVDAASAKKIAPFPCHDVTVKLFPEPVGDNTILVQFPASRFKDITVMTEGESKAVQATMLRDLLPDPLQTKASH